MSADNTITIFRFNDGSFRVGHVQAVEQFYGLSESNEGDGDSLRYLKEFPLFKTIDEAYDYAIELERDCDIVEYGITEIDVDGLS